MRSAACGQKNSPGQAASEWAGPKRCGNSRRADSQTRPRRWRESRPGPIETLRRRAARTRFVLVKARERRAGDILLKARRRNALEETKPKGASGASRINPSSNRKGRPQGSKPRSRGAAALDHRPGGCVDPQANGMWVQRRGDAPLPCRRRKLRRVNPTSAAGAKQSRQGREGRKPSRG